MIASFLSEPSAEEIELDPEYKKGKMEIESIQSDISDLRQEVENEIEKFFEQAFDSGAVDRMPPTDWLVEIQEGWEQKRIHENGRFDAWLRESEPGAELPPHYHPDQNRFIVLVDGEMTLTVYRDGEEEKTITLSKEEGEPQSLHLRPGTTVSAESIEDSVTVQVFEPPVAEESTRNRA